MKRIFKRVYEVYDFKTKEEAKKQLERLNRENYIIEVYSIYQNSNENGYNYSLSITYTYRY